LSCRCGGDLIHQQELVPENLIFPNIMELFEIDRNDVQKVRLALDEDDSTLLQVLSQFHTSEIARILQQLPQGGPERIIRVLPAEEASQVIAEMDEEHHPERLLEILSPEKINSIVEELEDDDAADIMSNLTSEKREEILDNLPEEDALSIRKLLQYPEDTAGGLMTPLLISVGVHQTKNEAIQDVIHQSEEMEEFYSIYVIDADQRLIGKISLKDLVKAKAGSLVGEITNRDIVYVYADTDQEEVAKLLSQYNISSIPVVDRAMVLLGRVTFDDVIDVMEEETTEDILKIAGVSEDEQLSGNWIDAIKSRLPWLFINLGTCFIPAAVVSHFDNVLQKLVILGAYQSIIAGMGGNAATQALAVTVRRITLQEISPGQAYNTVLKEIAVGLFNGFANGVIVFLAAIIFHGDPLLGLVLFLAMIGNLFVAGVTGSAIPLLLKRAGIDPAVSSSILITTFTDTAGFWLTYILAAKIILKL